MMNPRVTSPSIISQLSASRTPLRAIVITRSSDITPVCHLAGRFTLEPHHRAKCLPAEVALETRGQGVGHALAERGAGHLLRVARVVHVAALDERRRHLRQVEPAEVVAPR